MAKAIIANRIYIDADKGLQDYLASELTYKIPPRVKGGFPEIIKNFNRISGTVGSIPSGRLDLIPEGYIIQDKRILVPVDFPEFKFSLRDSQEAIYNDVSDSCIINAPVSWGKTFTAIAIARKLGQKTLIVTHTTMLRDQWAKEIEKTLGFIPAIIGSGKFGIDSPIVVANTQTLIKYTTELSETFGTLILDEAHHTPATTFTNIIDKSKARYKIGLTGTLERKDKKHIVFKDYFGSKVYKPEKENYMCPQVLIVESDVIFPGGKHWANKVTELEVYNTYYQKMIAELASSAANKGYKVLVVGSRVEFLKKCVELSTQPAAYITGEISSIDERMSILSKLKTNDLDIIYGTLSIFSEGISESSLSCVILATPINNDSLLTQLIGRIVRQLENKKQPLIIDINLKGATMRTQALNRKALYIKNGYDIKILKK